MELVKHPDVVHFAFQLVKLQEEYILGAVIGNKTTTSENASQNRFIPTDILVTAVSAILLWCYSTLLVG